MLFTTFGFLFLFLPITLVGWHITSRFGNQRISIAFLVAASLFFYGWWNPVYLVLLLGSILGNYLFGLLLQTSNYRRLLLSFGIGLNIALLGFFKYANFFVLNTSDVIGSN